MLSLATQHLICALHGVHDAEVPLRVTRWQGVTEVRGVEGALPHRVSEFALRLVGSPRLVQGRILMREGGVLPLRAIYAGSETHEAALRALGEETLIGEMFSEVARSYLTYQHGRQGLLLSSPAALSQEASAEARVLFGDVSGRRRQAALYILETETETGSRPYRSHSLAFGTKATSPQVVAWPLDVGAVRGHLRPDGTLPLLTRRGVVGSVAFQAYLAARASYHEDLTRALLPHYPALMKTVNALPRLNSPRSFGGVTGLGALRVQ